ERPAALRRQPSDRCTTSGESRTPSVSTTAGTWSGLSSSRRVRVPSGGMVGRYSRTAGDMKANGFVFCYHPPAMWRWRRAGGLLLLLVGGRAPAGGGRPPTGPPGAPPAAAAAAGGAAPLRPAGHRPRAPRR